MSTNINDLSVAERLNAPTPPLFKTIRRIGYLLVTLSGVAVALGTGGVALPIWVLVTAKTVAAVGATLAGTSSLAVDHTQIENEANNISLFRK